MNQATVADALAELDAYEAWRPALIAFYRSEGPWFQKVENLQRGDPLSDEDRHVIDGLIAAQNVREAA